MCLSGVCLSALLHFADRDRRRGGAAAPFKARGAWCGSRPLKWSARDETVATLILTGQQLSGLGPSSQRRRGAFQGAALGAGVFR